MSGQGERMEDFLIIERDGPIMIVRMNRPESHNALSEVAHMQEFSVLCQSVRHDPSVKVIVLTGNGKSFCAGGNVKDMRDRTGMFAGSPYEIRNGYRNGIQTIPLALYEVEVPVIAAVNGPAIGAGLDLACMCDIRIAADRALFAESFVRLGIVPGDGGAWLLQRVIGVPRATIMALTGETIDAARALEWGLVAEVVPGDALLDAALELAGKIAVNPAPALRLTKRLLREAQHLRLDSLLEMSAAYQAIAHHTDEHHNALAAFFDRRKPD